MSYKIREKLLLLVFASLPLFLPLPTLTTILISISTLLSLIQVLMDDFLILEATLLVYEKVDLNNTDD